MLSREGMRGLHVELRLANCRDRRNSSGSDLYGFDRRVLLGTMIQARNPSHISRDITERARYIRSSRIERVLRRAVLTVFRLDRVERGPCQIPAS